MQLLELPYDSSNSVKIAHTLNYKTNNNKYNKNWWVVWAWKKIYIPQTASSTASRVVSKTTSFFVQTES
jgi:hypothetical protein